MRRPFPKLNIRRFLAIILAVLLLSAVWMTSLSVSVSAAESGTCGDGLTWSLFAGVLTITGQGQMTLFSESDLPPWFELREEITSVSLPEGLTNIAPLAFYECKNLRSVYLPDSITSIGSYAFASCEGLEAIRLGDALATIDSAAFHSCYKLRTVTLPYSLQRLGSQAFYRCESLPTVIIPPYMSEMGSQVFAYCKSLIRAEIQAPLKTLPELTFYNCGNLHSVILPETVSAVEEYAFRKCEVLETVYFDGTEEKATEIRAGVSRDVPLFANSGVITDSPPMESVTAGKFTDNGDGTVTQQNVTVKNEDGMTVVSVVEHTYKADDVSGGSYTADITVSVDDKNAWGQVTDTVTETLKEVNASVALDGATSDTVDVTVFVQTEDGLDPTLIEEMAGRDVKLTIVTPGGNESRMECEDLVKGELSGNYDYSHTVTDASAEWSAALGTENCYKLTFNQSAVISSEILVQLSRVWAQSNAYLYQVEEDGALTRLQATVVDGNGNAHLYLASVDKDTVYVIGINVPGENSDDAIIPDELLSNYGEGVERFQKIDYVFTGRKSSWGLSTMQVTWIMLGVLAACIIIVGTVMAVWNRRRLKRGYAPDVTEYVDAGSEG